MVRRRKLLLKLSPPLVELSKQYNIPVEKLVELQRSASWSESDIRKGLELAKTYHRSLKTVSDMKRKLIEWDSVQKCFDLARQYNITHEEVAKLRGEKIPFGWEDINNALSRSAQFNVPAQRLLELKRTRAWDEIDRLLNTDKEWLNVTLEKLVELRIKMN